MQQLGSESANPTEVAKSILLVDDDMDILATFSILLSEDGYAVETAETGKEAIEKSKEKRFDIALLDIKLPDMKGTELLQALYGRSQMRKIMITGVATLANAVNSMNSGANAYLKKPVDPDLLLKVIEEQLLKQQLQI